MQGSLLNDPKFPDLSPCLFHYDLTNRYESCDANFASFICVEILYGVNPMNQSTFEIEWIGAKPNNLLASLDATPLTF